MGDYGMTYKSVPLMCDSSSAIFLVQNPIFYRRAKHIKVRHHFLRDHVEKRDIEMKYIDTERQLTDIFTKPLDATSFASLQGGTWCLPSLCVTPTFCKNKIFCANRSAYPIVVHMKNFPKINLA
jgi:hypothetical protein